jgi:DNA-binding LacI/PurR family transcriptional regulator
VTSNVVGPHGVRAPSDEDPQPYVSAERMRGWRETLATAGVEPVVVTEAHSTDQQGYEALGLLLDADPGITAVLCFSDALAHGVMLAAQDRGLAVPDRLSVVGYDDNPLAARLRPPLTTVRQDVVEKGRLAAAALVQGAQKAPATTDSGPIHVVLPTELVVRGSTGPPPG